MSPYSMGRAWAALVLVLLFAAVPVHAALENRAEDPIAADAEERMWYGDFEALERVYVQVQTSADINAINGRTAVGSVRSGMSSAFRYGDLNGFYFRELELLTASWARERPRSVLAQLLHARALYARAWHVRGGGYWSTVPEPAKAEFQRLISRALQQINDHAQLLASDTTTHIYLVMIGRSAGWTIAQQRAVVEDALARSTRDESELYDELATSMLPKWGGDWDTLTKFIDEVDTRTRERRGHELYARLWSMAADNIQGNLFKNTRADWPRVKQGLERLAAKYKHPWYANRLAYLACLADDRAAMKAALARIDGEPDVQSWAGGGAGGQQNYEACTRWADAASDTGTPQPKPTPHAPPGGVGGDQT